MHALRRSVHSVGMGPARRAIVPQLLLQRVDKPAQVQEWQRRAQTAILWVIYLSTLPCQAQLPLPVSLLRPLIHRCSRHRRSKLVRQTIMLTSRIRMRMLPPHSQLIHNIWIASMVRIAARMCTTRKHRHRHYQRRHLPRHMLVECPCECMSQRCMPRMVRLQVHHVRRIQLHRHHHRM